MSLTGHVLTGAEGSGYWSTNGITCTEFFYVGRGVKHIPLTTTALKDSGYAGGQDLLVKFGLSRAGGFDGPDTVQVFRQGSLTPTTTVPSFVVSGTVVPDRMTRLEFPENNSLLQIAHRAHDGLRHLYIAVHYTSCKTGVGRRSTAGDRIRCPDRAN